MVEIAVKDSSLPLEVLAMERKSAEQQLPPNDVHCVFIDYYRFTVLLCDRVCICLGA